MPLRNLLLVTYQFPPIGGSGVQRAAKLARYLPRAGWRVHVIAAGHTHYPLLDPSLTAKPDDDVIVHRVCGLEPAGVARAICRHFDQPDGGPDWLSGLEDRLYWRLDRVFGGLPLPETEMLWAPAAIRQARRLVERYGIEAVVTTSPPHTTHLVGMSLRRRLGLPWIADLRDPITDNFAYRPRRRLEDRFWRWLERSVVAQASHVVVTCPELARRLAERHGRPEERGFSTITNGFDPADAGRPLEPPPIQGKRFTLAYVGAFYREQTIGPLLEAVRALRARRADVAVALEVRLVGSLSAAQRRLVRPEDAAFFNNLGYRPHEEALREMARADAVLLLTPANEGGRLCIPAKAFEYLAFGGHIVAVVHRDTALGAILAEAGNVTLLHSHEPAALAAAIERRFDDWAAGRRPEPRDAAVVERFRRDRLAARFARIIDGCIDSCALAGTGELAARAAVGGGLE